MTDDQLWDLFKRIDSLIIVAPTEDSLRRKLNVLQRNGLGGWQLLRQPQIIDGRYFAVVVRMSKDVDDGKLPCGVPIGQFKNSWGE